MGFWGKALLGTLGQIVSLLNGGVASALRLVTNLVTGGFKMAFQFNETAMAFSRQAGLTAKQAQAYTEVLATRAKDLGAKYGIAAEEVSKLEKNLARATGRVMMLSSAEAERQIQINRTVGEDTANQFQESIIRTMGGQLSTVQGAVSKAYATAAKKGLDAAGMAAKVGQNLSMANRLTFKNGVDGLTKMVALSEKFGFNIQSLESAANSFMDLQDSIENAAKLSMLGGAAGAFGSNPLDMSYEANYDPEAFGERMTKMLGGYARFDTKTGMSKMNAMSRDFVKGIADAMHISLDEATSIAKRQAEVQFKNNRFGGDLDRLAGGDENKRDFLLNKSQYNTQTGKLEMKGLDNEYHELSYFQKGGKGEGDLKEMMRFNGMTDSEIMEEQARAVVSINDKLTGWVTSLQGILAEKIAPFIPQIQKFLGDLYNMFLPHAGQIAENVKSLMQQVFDNLPLIKSTAKGIIGAIAGIAKFITSHWALLIGAAFLTPILGGFASVVASILRTAGLGGGARGGARGKNTTTKNRTLKQAKNDAKLGMRGKKGLWSKGRSGFGTLMKNSRLVRGASKSIGVIGTALAVGDMAYSLYDWNKKTKEIEADKNKTEKEKEEAKQKVNHDTSKAVGGGAGALAGGLGGAKIGAIIGTAIAPGIGTAIGGFLGGAIGGAAGYFAGEAAGGAIVPEKHALGGIVGGNNYTGDKVITALNSGEAVSTKAEQAQFLAAIRDIRGSLGVSVGDNIVYNNSRNGVSNYTAVGPKYNSTVQSNLESLSTNVTAKPVGGKEYIYTPSNGGGNTVGGDITVKDFNINISGTIRLDGGSNSQNIDVRNLLNDVSFVSKLKDIIRESMASDINGGRVMNDTAYLRGMPSQSTTLGKLIY